MSNVQPAPRAIPLRPDRGIMSVIEGGYEAAEAATALEVEVLPSADIEAVTLSPRNYQAALSLLEYAAKALEMLYDRRDQLEASLEDVSMRAESALMSAQAKVNDWQKLAAGLKGDVQEMERRLAGMQKRAEQAEAQAAAERNRADAAERRAAEALNLSQGLHTKIMSAFGRGSSAHKALMVAVDDGPAG